MKMQEVGDYPLPLISYSQKQEGPVLSPALPTLKLLE
jgi:hypothetical protein